jgi:hypothetical protein
MPLNNRKKSGLKPPSKTPQKSGVASKLADESGNAFMFILIGIVLFAAISFVMSRGFRSEGTSNLSARQAELAAIDIVTYAQRIERAVSAIRRKDISEGDISLEHNGGFINANCNDAADRRFPECQVFHPQGGNISPQTPPLNSNDGTNWHFTGATCIEGAAVTGCDSDGQRNEDLIAVLRNINQSVCTAINRRVGIDGIPVDAGGGFSATPFTGTFPEDTEIALAGGPFTAACYQNGGAFHFYSILIKR